MTAPPARRGPLGRLGRRARRGLCIVLVALSAALLLRPVLFLTAALGGDGDGGDLAPAVVATAFHVTILVLAVTLLRRTAAP